MADHISREPRYPMRVVIQRTGLTPDLLRAWERRYAAVKPDRSAGGQRLYSEDDVIRLGLLRRVTLAGHRIAEVAQLDATALEALLEEKSPRATVPDEALDAIVASAIAATERLDGAAIEGALKRGALAVGAAAMVDRVVSRFLRQVGELWHAGRLSPAHEHLASTAVRNVLRWTTEAYALGARAPRLVVATPSGELHEFGAMLAAAAAMEEGWRVIYLGASLPPEDLARAASQLRARAVALSAVYSNGAANLGEVAETARALPRGTVMIVGGAAAEHHREILEDAGARVLSDIPALRRLLRALRTATPAEAHGPPPTTGEE